MPTDLSIYKVAAGEKSSSTKFDNLVQSIQNSLNGIGDTTQTSFAGGKIFDPAKLLQNGATTGQALVWNGTSWAPGGAGVNPKWVGYAAGTGGESVTWTANQAILVPFDLQTSGSINSIQFLMVTTGGSYDVGIYTAAGARQVSKGSTAVPGSGPLVSASVTLTALTAGQYYLAFACDSGVAAFGAVTVQHTTAQVYQRKVLSSFPLPATITPGAANAPAALILSAPVI